MIGYWLLPAEPARAWFVSTTGELARKYHAPVFEPHVTLYSGGDEEDEHARSLIDRIAIRTGAIELQVGGVEHSEKFTKTLFVQLRASESARQLSDAIRAGSESPRDYDFNPHVSLLYAHIPHVAKVAETERIHVPFDHVRFDALAAVFFPKPIETGDDVENWRIIGKATLL